MVKNSRNIPLVEHSRTTNLSEIVLMCDEGRYLEAREMAEDLPNGPEKNLITGASLVASRPEEAKDLLSSAARLLKGDLAERALIWLGACYWAVGEKGEARATLESVTPVTPVTSFLLGLNRSILESQTPAVAMPLLDSIESYADSVTPLLRGKFFHQRGYLLRRLGQLDRAIIAYEEAKYWLEKVENPSYAANVANNLSSVYADLNDFEQAHRSVDQAIAVHEKSRQAKYLSDAYDNKAQIFIKQKKYVEAAKMSERASDVLLDGDQKETRARALLTEACALSASGNHIEALVRLGGAQDIAHFLANRDLLFDVAEAKVSVARKVLESYDIDRINLTLEMSNGSFRVAAQKLGTTHPRLSRWIRKYDLKWNGNKPLSINPRQI